MNFLAMAGFKANEIVAAMPGVLNLAAAGQMDLARTADIASNILTGFGLSANETNRVVDVMAKTMTSSNTNIEQLGYAMKYVAPISAQLGMSIEETAATIGRLSDAGLQGEMAGTILRGILSSIISPSNEAAKAMKEFNISVKDSQGNLLSLPDIIGNLKNGFSGLTDAQRAQVAETIVGREAVSGLLALMSAGSENIAQFTSELEGAGGTASELAESQMDTLNGAIKELGSALEAVGITVGEKFAPAVREVAETLNKVALGFENMDDPMQNALITFTAMVPVVGSLVTGFYALRMAVVALQMSVPVLAAITLAVSGLAAGFVYLKSQSEATDSQLKRNHQTAYGLAQEYDKLSAKLNTLEANSLEAKEAKRQMNEIMERIKQLAPSVAAQFDNMAGSVNNLTTAYVNNTRAALENLQAKLKDKQAEYASLKNKENSFRGGLLTESALATKKNAEIFSMRQEIAALESVLNSNANSIGKYEFDWWTSANRPKSSGGGGGGLIDTYNSGGSYSGDYFTEKEKAASKKSPKPKQGKTAEQIAQEQFQTSMRWVQYKKNLNQLSVEDELSAYERLLKSYGKYSEMKMQLDEQIYRVKGELGSESFEQSVAFIEKEERRMRLANESEKDVANEKLAMWERVKKRYAEHTDEYKRADREVYQLKLTLLREEETATRETQEEIRREREKTKREVESNLKNLRSKFIDNLKEQEKAELDSLDRRKREISDFYDEQIEKIDETERAEERAETEAELQKYLTATSKDGIAKRKELEDRLRKMDRDEQRRQLKAERDTKLRALDDEKRDLRDHYERLRTQVEDFNGGRIDQFKSANETIIEELKEFVKSYNAELAKMNNGSSWASTGGSAVGKVGNSSGSGVSSGGGTVGSGSGSSSGGTSQVSIGGSIFKKHHTGGIVGQNNFVFGDRLLPNEVASILQKDEVVFQPKQLGDLLNAAKGGGQTINNYNAPLIQSGDTKIEDSDDASTYWRERELAAQRLMAGGER